MLEDHIDELRAEKQIRLNLVKSISKDANLLKEENHIKIDEWSSLNQIKKLSDETNADNVKLDKKTINRYRKSLEKVSIIKKK